MYTPSGSLVRMMDPVFGILKYTYIYIITLINGTRRIRTYSTVHTQLVFCLSYCPCLTVLPCNARQLLLTKTLFILLLSMAPWTINYMARKKAYITDPRACIIIRRVKASQHEEADLYSCCCPDSSRSSFWRWLHVKGWIPLPFKNWGILFIDNDVHLDGLP